MLVGTAIPSARKPFRLFKCFLFFPVTEPRYHERTDGVNPADMGEFVTDVCNEQND